MPPSTLCSTSISRRFLLARESCGPRDGRHAVETERPCVDFAVQAGKTVFEGQAKSMGWPQTPKFGEYIRRVGRLAIGMTCCWHTLCVILSSSCTVIGCICAESPKNHQQARMRCLVHTVAPPSHLGLRYIHHYDLRQYYSFCKSVSTRHVYSQRGTQPRRRPNARALSRPECQC